MLISGCKVREYNKPKNKPQAAQVNTPGDRTWCHNVYDFNWIPIIGGRADSKDDWAQTITYITGTIQLDLERSLSYSVQLTVVAMNSNNYKMNSIPKMKNLMHQVFV